MIGEWNEKHLYLRVGLMATAVLTGCVQTKADGERNDKLESFNRNDV